MNASAYAHDRRMPRSGSVRKARAARTRRRLGTVGYGGDGKAKHGNDVYRAALASQLGTDPDAHESPLYIVDLSGRIVYCNRAFAEITGYRQTELMGRLSILLYVPEATPTFLIRRMQALRGAPVPPNLNTTLRAYGGSKVPVELSVQNFLIDGRIAGRVATVRKNEPHTASRRLGSSF